MKLVSWNVNGFRAVLNKGFEKWFTEENADIVCLQEIKLSEGQVDFAPEGYCCFWNYAEKKGYSGTAVFTKVQPLSVEYGQDNEGRVLCLEFNDYFLINVYTPNSQEGLKRLDYRIRWDRDFKEYAKFKDLSKPVFICGDMNVAHKEIDLKNPKANMNNAGFTFEERNGFSNLLNEGFIDVFRFFYPDLRDAYSWFSYRFKAREKNIGWRIDYWLVSERYKDRVSDCSIESNVQGSDHVPVLILLK